MTLIFSLLKLMKGTCFVFQCSIYKIPDSTWNDRMPVLNWIVQDRSDTNVYHVYYSSILWWNGFILAWCYVASQDIHRDFASLHLFEIYMVIFYAVKWLYIISLNNCYTIILQGQMVEWSRGEIIVKYNYNPHSALLMETTLPDGAVHRFIYKRGNKVSNSWN